MDPGNQLAQIIDGLVSGDRRMLSKAITLVESRHGRDRKIKTELMRSIQSHRHPSVRIGITGSPGVGKSTFLNGFVRLFRGSDHRIAILTIDPSSNETGGSILGDKLRMKNLFDMDQVYIRPSPSKGTLGGINLTTWETMQICEAAGFDYIFIETVGVGQSEIEVQYLVDEIWYLTMARSGDEIQGIKRGILEVVDRIIVTKADLDPVGAKSTLALLRQSLKVIGSRENLPAFYKLSAHQSDTMESLFRDLQTIIPGPLSPEQLTFWYSRGWQESILTWIQSDPGMKKLYVDMLEHIHGGKMDYWSAMENLNNELSEIWRK